MIEEAYVSFETAKLLKEKRFNEGCSFVVNAISKSVMHVSWPTTNSDIEDEKARLIALPTQQMAMRWLREKYNIYISIQPDFPSEKDYKMCWCWSANILHENCISMKRYQCYIETYEEATEAALKYSLENLI